LITTSTEEEAGGGRQAGRQAGRHAHGEISTPTMMMMNAAFRVAGCRLIFAVARFVRLVSKLPILRP
jgi:hypothetical protein